MGLSGQHDRDFSFLGFQLSEVPLYLGEIKTAQSFCKGLEGFHVSLGEKA